jgi:hypothetical protein
MFMLSGKITAAAGFGKITAAAGFITLVCLGVLAQRACDQVLYSP